MNLLLLLLEDWLERSESAVEGTTATVTAATAATAAEPGAAGAAEAPGPGSAASSVVITGTATLAPPDRRFHHIQDVIRSSLGDTLKVGELNGLVGTGTITTLAEHRIDIAVRLHTKATLPSPVALIIALPEKNAILKVIHTCTILGVKKLVFVDAANVSSATWGADATKRSAVNDVMRLGLEQTVDTTLPEVLFRRDTEQFMRTELPDMMAGANNLILARQPSSAVQMVACCPPEPAGRACNLVIGPDNLNFTAAEEAKFVALGFELVSFGRRVMPLVTAINSLLGRIGM